MGVGINQQRQLARLLAYNVKQQDGQVMCLREGIADVSVLLVEALI